MARKFVTTFVRRFDGASVAIVWKGHRFAGLVAEGRRLHEQQVALAVSRRSEARALLTPWRHRRAIGPPPAHEPLPARRRTAAVVSTTTWR